MSKYREDKWGWVPKRVPRYRLSWLWVVISSFGDVSKKMGSFLTRDWDLKLGRGVRVRFGIMNGCVGPLCLRFQRLFRVVSNKESSVKECYVWVRVLGIRCLAK